MCIRDSNTAHLTDASQMLNLDELARVAKKYGLSLRVTAVSYTHLDVYKRQLLYISTLFLSRSVLLILFLEIGILILCCRRIILRCV